MTNIKRPDLRKPNQYEIGINEDFLLFVEDGLLKKIEELEYWVGEHNGCNLQNDQGCSVRHTWILNQYGTIEVAAEHGVHMSDCSQDLSHYHKLLYDAYDFLAQSRFARRNRTSHGLHEIRDAEETLNNLKDEVAYREHKATDDTGLLDVIEVNVDDIQPKPEQALAVLEDKLSKGNGEPTGEVVAPFQDPQKGDDASSLLGLKDAPASSPK